MSITIYDRAFCEEIYNYCHFWLQQHPDEGEGIRNIVEAIFKMIPHPPVTEVNKSYIDFVCEFISGKKGPLSAFARGLWVKIKASMKSRDWENIQVYFEDRRKQHESRKEQESRKSSEEADHELRNFPEKIEQHSIVIGIPIKEEPDEELDEIPPPAAAAAAAIAANENEEEEPSDDSLDGLSEFFEILKRESDEMSDDDDKVVKKEDDNDDDNHDDDNDDDDNDGDNDDEDNDDGADDVDDDFANVVLPFKKKKVYSTPLGYQPSEGKKHCFIRHHYVRKYPPIHKPQN